MHAAPPPFNRGSGALSTGPGRCAVPAGLRQHWQRSGRPFRRPRASRARGAGDGAERQASGVASGGADAGHPCLRIPLHARDLRARLARDRHPDAGFRPIAGASRSVSFLYTSVALTALVLQPRDPAADRPADAKMGLYARRASALVAAAGSFASQNVDGPGRRHGRARRRESACLNVTLNLYVLDHVRREDFVPYNFDAARLCDGRLDGRALSRRLALRQSRRLAGLCAQRRVRPAAAGGLLVSAALGDADHRQGPDPAGAADRLCRPLRRPAPPAPRLADRLRPVELLVDLLHLRADPDGGDRPGRGSGRPPGLARQRSC